MIQNCIKHTHQVHKYNGYRICLSEYCSNRAVKISGAFVDHGSKRELEREKKQILLARITRRFEDITVLPTFAEWQRKVNTYNP